MKRIDDFVRREIINASKNGYNGKDIAKRFNVSPSTVYRILEKNYNAHNSIVTEYIPDYKRIINPQRFSTQMFYGGVQFTVNHIEKTIVINSLDNFQQEGEFIFDEHNIDELKSMGEALVGIACSFKDLVENRNLEKNTYEKLL